MLFSCIFLHLFNSPLSLNIAILYVSTKNTKSAEWPLKHEYKEKYTKKLLPHNFYNRLRHLILLSPFTFVSLFFFKTLLWAFSWLRTPNSHCYSHLHIAIELHQQEVLKNYSTDTKKKPAYHFIALTRWKISPDWTTRPGSISCLLRKQKAALLSWTPSASQSVETYHPERASHGLR